MTTNDGTKWKNAFSKTKPYSAAGDDFQIEHMKEKIKRVKRKKGVKNYKNIHELRSVYDTSTSTVEGFLDNPDDANNQKLSTVDECKKRHKAFLENPEKFNNKEPECDYEGFDYDDPLLGNMDQIRKNLVNSITSLFRGVESVNIKFAKKIHAMLIGEKIKSLKEESDIETLFNRFLDDVSYYNVDQFTAATCPPNGSSCVKLVTDYYDKTKNTNGKSYHSFIVEVLQTDIDSLTSDPEYKPVYLPSELLYKIEKKDVEYYVVNGITNSREIYVLDTDSSPKVYNKRSDAKNDARVENLRLLKYIHDVLVLEEYFGLMESHGLSAWCYYNLYFAMFIGKLPEVSDKALFNKAKDSGYWGMIEYFFSSSAAILSYPEFLIRKGLRIYMAFINRMAERTWHIKVLPVAFITIIVFILIIVFLRYFLTFLKDFFIKFLTLGVDPSKTDWVTIALIIVVAVNWFTYVPRLLRGESITLDELLKDHKNPASSEEEPVSNGDNSIKLNMFSVMSYFVKYVEKFGYFAIILFIFQFILHLLIAIPSGLFLCVIYLIIVMFFSIVMFYSVIPFSIIKLMNTIDDEVQEDVKSHIKLVEEKISDEKWYKNIILAVLYILAFIDKIKFSLAFFILYIIIIVDVYKRMNTKLPYVIIFALLLYIGSSILFNKISDVNRSMAPPAQSTA